MSHRLFDSRVRCYKVVRPLTGLDRGD